MRFLRQCVIPILVIVALLLPLLVYAAGTYYATNDPTASPSGKGTSWLNARYAKTDKKIIKACKSFGQDLSPGDEAVMEWFDINNSEICYYDIRVDLNAKVNCTAGGCEYTQDPPRTGVDLPPPLVIGGLFGLGALLLAAAWWLRRRGLRSA
jgi:hypothetical protein